METFVPFVKLGLDLLTSSGISTIVSNAVKKVTPENLTAWQKASTKIASFVIGSMAAYKASEYIDEKVDDIVGIANAFIQNNNETEVEVDYEE